MEIGLVDRASRNHGDLRLFQRGRVEVALNLLFVLLAYKVSGESGRGWTFNGVGLSGLEV